MRIKLMPLRADRVLSKNDGYVVNSRAFANKGYRYQKTRITPKIPLPPFIIFPSAILVSWSSFVKTSKGSQSPALSFTWTRHWTISELLVRLNALLNCLRHRPFADTCRTRGCCSRYA